MYLPDVDREDLDWQNRVSNRLTLCINRRKGYYLIMILKLAGIFYSGINMSNQDFIKFHTPFQERKSKHIKNQKHTKELSIH